MEMDELGTAIPIIPLLYLLVFTWHTAGIHAQHAPLGGNLLANRGRASHVGLRFKKMARRGTPIKITASGEERPSVAMLVEERRQKPTATDHKQTVAHGLVTLRRVAVLPALYLSYLLLVIRLCSIAYKGGFAPVHWHCSLK